jgi:hypothetical protein
MKKFSDVKQGNEKKAGGEPSLDVIKTLQHDDHQSLAETSWLDLDDNPVAGEKKVGGEPPLDVVKTLQHETSTGRQSSPETSWLDLNDNTDEGEREPVSGGRSSRDDSQRFVREKPTPGDNRRTIIETRERIQRLLPQKSISETEQASPIEQKTPTLREEQAKIIAQGAGLSEARAVGDINRASYVRILREVGEREQGFNLSVTKALEQKLSENAFSSSGGRALAESLARLPGDPEQIFGKSETAFTKNGEEVMVTLHAEPLMGLPHFTMSKSDYKIINDAIASKHAQGYGSGRGEQKGKDADVYW